MKDTVCPNLVLTNQIPCSILCPLYKWDKVCENSRASENRRLRHGFSLTCSRILTNVRFGRFSPDYEVTESMFYFFFKIIVFQLNKEKTIYETRMYSFISFMKLWMLTTWRQQSYRSCHFRVSQRYENTLVYQSNSTNYPNYFINYFYRL